MELSLKVHQGRQQQYSIGFIAAISQEGVACT
jgi:hypothetical protein